LTAPCIQNDEGNYLFEIVLSPQIVSEEKVLRDVVSEDDSAEVELLEYINQLLRVNVHLVCLTEHLLNDVVAGHILEANVGLLIHKFEENAFLVLKARVELAHAPLLNLTLFCTATHPHHL
jgi:hypothetical protein